jgi:D-alanine-D-alanine ligase
VRLLHLVGSPVDEFHAELSRLYAAGCLEALGDRYEHAIAYVAPGDVWSFPSSLSALSGPTFSRSEALSHIASLGVDVVVPQMFCPPGMTEYRALFDDLGIPYVGNPPAVMATAMDKARAREVVAAAGVPVPAGRVVVDDFPIGVTLPVVVKPVASDNSEGVSLVRDASEYPAAVRAALAHGEAALVESYVELGREVRCGIVVRDGQPVCLPLEEYAVDAVTKPIRDRADKLERTADGDLYLVAKNDTRAWIVPESDPATERVWEVARRCHDALGCRHYSLFDFRIDPDGQPWFLEAGPYCSFAPTSVIAVMAAAASVSVDRLFADALGELERSAACG